MSVREYLEKLERQRLDPKAAFSDAEINVFRESEGTIGLALCEKYNLNYLKQELTRRRAENIKDNSEKAVEAPSLEKNKIKVGPET